MWRLADVGIGENPWGGGEMVVERRARRLHRGLPSPTAAGGEAHPAEDAEGEDESEDGERTPTHHRVGSCCTFGMSARHATYVNGR